MLIGNLGNKVLLVNNGPTEWAALQDLNKMIIMLTEVKRSYSMLLLMSWFLFTEYGFARFSVLQRLYLTDEIGVGLAGSFDPVLLFLFSTVEERTVSWRWIVCPVTANERKLYNYVLGHFKYSDPLFFESGRGQYKQHKHLNIMLLKLNSSM